MASEIAVDFNAIIDVILRTASYLWTWTTLYVHLTVFNIIKESGQSKYLQNDRIFSPNFRTGRMLMSFKIGRMTYYDRRETKQKTTEIQASPGKVFNNHIGNRKFWPRRISLQGLVL